MRPCRAMRWRVLGWIFKKAAASLVSSTASGVQGTFETSCWDWCSTGGADKRSFIASELPYQIRWVVRINSREIPHSWHLSIRLLDLELRPFGMVELLLGHRFNLLWLLQLGVRRVDPSRLGLESRVP